MNADEYDAIAAYTAQFRGEAVEETADRYYMVIWPEGGDFVILGDAKKDGWVNVRRLETGKDYTIPRQHLCMTLGK